MEFAGRRYRRKPRVTGFAWREETLPAAEVHNLEIQSPHDRVQD